MMSNVVLKIEDISKIYRLGEVGTGTISHDLNVWFDKIRGKENSFSKISEINDVSVRNMSDYVYALKNVSFDVKKGEVLGVIGNNGAGKSTLLKLISNITCPTSGSIKAKGRIASLLEIGTGMHPEMTARENIYLNGAILGMKKKEINSKFNEIIAFAGIAKYIDTPVKRFSSGMRVRLGFAVAAYLEPDILIVDEVLAVGDADFQKKAIGKIQDVSSNEGRTVLFVSHNMNSVRRLCNKAIILDKGELIYNGNVDDAISKYINKDHIYKNNINSIIPESNRLYNTGEAKFLECKIVNSSLEKTNQLYFREEFKIVIILEIYKEIQNISILVTITNSFGEKIGMLALKDSNYHLELLKIGKKEISFDFLDNLLPDDYMLNLGISYYLSGSSIDYVEHISGFKVNKELKKNEFEYPWVTKHGYVEFDNNFQIKNI